MWIVRLALRRPYTFVVAALVLLLLSPFVLLRTPTDIFPAISIPVVSAVWVYNGLSAQEVEERIVYNHERMISAQVADIEHIESTAYDGAGVIKVFLQPGASVSDGVAQITASAQAVLRFLPPGTIPPFVIRYNASTVPILQYSLASKKLSEQEIQDLAQNQVRVGLSTVQGASVPLPFGGKTRVVAVDLDLPAIEAKHLTPQDVVNAFNAQNFVLPSGTAKIGLTEYNVSLNTNPPLLTALNDLPVKTVQGAVIRVGDVAQVHDGYVPQQNVVRLDGARGVLLTILKSGSASTLSVVNGVKKVMPRILSGLPPDLDVKEFADQSLFVRAAVDSVVREGVIAAALTAAMILLFLGSWRSTFIIALSIPLSVVSSLVVLETLGETINLMTLGGVALAVGILVDDATVAIENVHCQMAAGKPIVQAILDGAQEIALPAFVSTLCICIVFVPMFFLTGVARHLFVPLAEAVVFAMLASYALSRTLVPTLVMWLYRGVEYRAHAPAPGSVRGWLRPFAAIGRRFEGAFVQLREAHGRALTAVLRHRVGFAAGFLTACGASLLLIPQLGQDFFPSVDAGQFRLHMRAPTGTRIEETTRLTDAVERVIREELPGGEIGGMLDNIGMPAGGIQLTYADSGLTGARDADILVSLRPGHGPTSDHVRRLRSRLAASFPGATFYFLPADIVNQTVNFGLPAPLDIQLVTLRALDAERQLLASSIDVYRKSLELTRNRRAGGLGSDLDVAQAETILNTSEAQLVDTALQRARFQNALAVLTGKVASVFVIPERPLGSMAVAVPEGLPSELLERRPDIAAAERRMAAANAGIGVAEAAFFPTIRLGVSAGFQSGGFDTLFVLPSRFWAVGPSMSLPLFQGGRLRANLRQAQAFHEETIARYRQTVLAAFAEVENNLAAERLLAKEQAHQSAALESSRKQLEIANNRYRSGLVTYLEVATAQNTALAIERASTRLRGQQVVTSVALIKSLGGGWGTPGG
jgi:multidrug efflux pump subunit AcrB